MNTRLRALALASAARELNRTTPQSLHSVRQDGFHPRVGNRTVWSALLAGYHGHVGVIQNLYSATIPDSV